LSAVEEFGRRLDSVIDLLDQVAPGWSPRLGQSGSAAAPLLRVGELSRAALVLTVSYFEGFLKDLVDEALDDMVSRRLPCVAVPALLQGQAVMSHVAKLRSSSHAEEVWEAVNGLIEIRRLIDMGEPVQDRILARDEIKRGITSIDPKNVNAFLKALGDSNLNRGVMSQYAARLNGLKQIRDNAVHGNEMDLPPLGFADVESCLILVRSCAEDLGHRVVELLQEVYADCGLEVEAR
jgi:hypothetical protein